MREKTYNTTLKTVYGYIVQYKGAHDGLGPSLREIQKNCGVASTSHAHYCLRRLSDLGLIRIKLWASRHIEVVGARWIPPVRALEGDLTLPDSEDAE